MNPFSHRERKAREADQDPASVFHQGQRHRRTKSPDVWLQSLPARCYAIDCLANWGRPCMCENAQCGFCAAHFRARRCDNRRFETLESSENERTWRSFYVFTQPRPEVAIAVKAIDESSLNFERALETVINQNAYCERLRQWPPEVLCQVLSTSSSF